MQITRRNRLVVSSLLGLSLVTTTQPLHAMEAGGDVSLIEAAGCYSRYLVDVLTTPLTAGGRYGQCLERAAED